jgi:hypothetical protein
MHRINTPTALPDKFGQGKNGYTDGDPATGRRATDLNANMFDSLQEEICNVIESADIALDENKRDQLATAIVTLISKTVGGEALLVANDLKEIADKGTDAMKAARENIGAMDAEEADKLYLQKTGDEFSGHLKATGGAEIQSTSDNAIRFVSGEQGLVFRIFGNYLMLTPTELGDPYGEGDDVDSPLNFAFDGSYLTTGAIFRALKAAEFYEGTTFKAGAIFQANINVSWGGRTAVYQENGDINGTVWGGNLSAWLNASKVNDVRLSGRTHVGGYDGDIHAPAGCVFVSIGDFGANNGYGYYAVVQRFINGAWYTVSHV